MKFNLNRRQFLAAVGGAAAPAILGCGSQPTIQPAIDKRAALLDLVQSASPPDYVPAAFFLHFDPSLHFGPGAIEKHLEYFRYTGMDFVKIQYERTFPQIPEIQTPRDWSKMPLYKEDFYEPQIKVVEGLVKEAKKEALVLVTLYSPFMCAGHTVGDELLTRHILESPEEAKQGMEIVTESVMLFVKACIQAGVDGFYASTQGGEAHRFSEPGPFLECIKPYDLAIMEEINRSCIFNILHVCDYNGPYDDLSPFLDYPGDVVNCSLEVGGNKMTMQQASDLFSRPYMGGLERLGTIAQAGPAEIVTEVENVLKEAPERFILGADCTVPSETPWDNLRTAIETAHHFKRTA